MRVDASAIQFSTSHVATRHHAKLTTLNMWVGDRRPDFERQGRVSISPAAIASAETEQSATVQAIEEAAKAVENDPKMLLIRAVIEMLTGQEVRRLSSHLSAPTPAPATGIKDPNAATATNAPQRAGFGLEFDHHEVYEETEQTSFQAQGLVRTADGQEIRFEIRLLMQRSYREETKVSMRLGDAVQKDPLVVNFAGTAAQLQSQRFDFDLDSDGAREQVPLLAGNRGFLALDLNGNRRVDSGRELFGPATGDGFSELAQHDHDGNGWIDERDPVFGQLRIWTPEGEGPGALASLADRGVGAISLTHAETPFELRNANNQSLGTVRATGAYLAENGNAGTVQQIDLTS
ncbi:MAG TPA: hypothetical protein VLJ57_01900 [Burkholderiaceae bacterium]|nr:hypothetical protein [Burkholderiaceae bacterium]